MRTVKYGHFCEDSAIRIFLENFLKLVPAHLNKEIHLIKTQSTSSLIPTNRIQVLNNYCDAAIHAFAMDKVELFFVGMDFDDWDRNRFVQQHSELHNRLDAKLRAQTIILLPVQAVEHWLLYLKHKQDNPQTTKNPSLDGKNRNEAKFLLYKTKRVRTAVSDPIVNELTSYIDIPWLKDRSPSFNHFCQSLEIFCKSLD